MGEWEILTVDVVVIASITAIRRILSIEIILRRVRKHPRLRWCRTPSDRRRWSVVSTILPIFESGTWPPYNTFLQTFGMLFEVDKSELPRFIIIPGLPSVDEIGCL